jgi:hypothetical protein
MHCIVPSSVLAFRYGTDTVPVTARARREGQFGGASDGDWYTQKGLKVLTN